MKIKNKHFIVGTVILLSLILIGYLTHYFIQIKGIENAYEEYKFLLDSNTVFKENNKEETDSAIFMAESQQYVPQGIRSSLFDIHYEIQLALEKHGNKEIDSIYIKHFSKKVDMEIRYIRNNLDSISPVLETLIEEIIVNINLIEEKEISKDLTSVSEIIQKVRKHNVKLEYNIISLYADTGPPLGVE